MISLKGTPTLSDTLVAWNKIMKIRKRLQDGESFEKLASELSQDPSAKNNDGNLGYFTAFQMVYPFESAAFNNKIGEISMPVRSRFGYHLIKTTDKRPARGEVKVAHIMAMVPQGAPDSSWSSAELKIKEIESRLKAGADFSMLAKEQSDDRGSAQNGGELPSFGTGRMIPEFEQAAFELRHPGDISKPVKTFYGWHIIRLIEKKGIPEFDNIKHEIRSKISKDERLEIASNSLVTRLKREYNFIDTVKLLEDLSLNPDYKTETKVKQILFRFSDQVFLLNDFINYLNSLQKPDSTTAFLDFVKTTYNTYVKRKLIDYEDRMLEIKYPDFKSLVMEYHDGILLFNISDSLIWSKASKDTAGIEKYFATNRKKYQWPKRIEASVVRCSSPEVAQNAQKYAQRLKTPESLTLMLAKIICDSTHRDDCLTINYNKFAKGDNRLTDKIVWKKGLSQIIEIDGASEFAVIHNLIPPRAKTLDESRGFVISDYQNFLEKEWLNALRNKYLVNVNNDVLNQLKKEYASKN
jgi:peptidyl-prolyl cis-trans isomerase SurA